jgi:hypothetical protein
MATIETWATEKLSEYTSIYPFVGTEWLWLIVAVVFWLWWHVKTSAKETEEQDRLRSENPGRDAHKQYQSGW